MSRPPIKDEFTDLPISRQRKFQMRMKRDGKCTKCGKPVIKGSKCLAHLIMDRERLRKAKGAKKRYYGTLSYRLKEASR